jgi:hypothetical protein
MAATIGDVMDDVTVQVLYMDDPGLTHWTPEFSRIDREQAISWREFSQIWKEPRMAAQIHA